jgi:CO/xanthine dehydrogenase FAD-binding subunit
MHSEPAQFSLQRAASLEEALALLAAEPGRYTPMAGGTELMVAFNTGRLAPKALLSIQHLRELRYIRFADDRVHLGAGTTFSDLRRHEQLRREFPLLGRAASWTGAIANQNRGTLGGNICNASPAADTPPVLLACDADITLVRAGSTRTLPYSDFHLGYKKTVLRPDELVLELSLPRQGEVHSYLRKVGTRRAQAISKTALAGIARVEGERIQHIRLGAASLADRPVRLLQTEAVLHGASLSPTEIEDVLRAARAALAAEAKPIDDIRSTARYRTAVAANLLEEFVRGLAG